MKIAIVLPTLYMGGGEKFAVDLSNELAKDFNHQVTLCILSKINQNMTLYHSIHPEVTIVSLNKDKGFNYKIIFKLQEFLKSNKFDITHTHLRSIVYTLYSTLSIENTKFIHTFHTLIEKEVPFYLYKFLLKKIFKSSKVIPVAITPTVLEGIQENFGNSQNNIILNGVSPLQKSNEFKNVHSEINSYKKNIHTKVFINVGRVTKVKNQKLLIETFKKLDKNAILIIIGSLTNEPNYAKECQEFAKNTDNIFFLDEKNNVGDYLECADALCLASIYEGLPLVILEAMSLGKPTLSTSVGGIPDVIKNNINGFLSKDMSSNSYLQIIDNFMMNKIDQNTIYNEFKNKYSMEICKEHYNNLYKRTLKD